MPTETAGKINHNFPFKSNTLIFDEFLTTAKENKIHGDQRGKNLSICPLVTQPQFGQNRPRSLLDIKKQ